MEYNYQQDFEVTDDILATNQQRLLNYLIDYGVQILIGGALGAGIGFISYFLGKPEVLDFIANMNRIEEYIFGIIITLIYYNLTEIFMARSIGKFVTKTVVVMEDGSKPDYKTIMIRTICRIIPFNHFSFLGTPCRGWHDSLSKTYVVKKSLLDEKRELFYSFSEIGKTEEI